MVTGLSVGGAERQVLDLADRFVCGGHVVRIAYLTGPVLLRPVCDSVGLSDLRVKKSIFGLFIGLFNLVALIREFRPDVVHSHMVHANILSRLSRILVRFPRLICTAHSNNEGGRLRMLAYRVTDALADCSTNVSVEAVAAFEKNKAVPAGRMIPVLNGVDVEKFKPDILARQQLRGELGLTGKKVFVAVGRLVDAKDYPNLLRSFVSVYEREPDAVLLIVGGGPLENQLEELAFEFGISKAVRFLGVRHDVPKVLNAADIFVLSSAWEGFGLVVAEAMATELVVVATDCGGVAEVIGECGFLVPACNSQELAKAMLDALALKEDEIAEIGKSSRKRVVDKYSLDAVVRRWIEIYNS